MTYIRIARRSREKEFESAMSGLHEQLFGAILPLASMDDEELAEIVPDFLRRHQLPFEVWVVYADDVAQYFFEHGNVKAADFIDDKKWVFFWFPKDMCDVLEKRDFN